MPADIAGEDREVERLDPEQQTAERARREERRDQSDRDARGHDLRRPASTTIRRTRSGCAPSAMRTPISRVRSATTYDSTP